MHPPAFLMSRTGTWLAVTLQATARSHTIHDMMESFMNPNACNATPLRHNLGVLRRLLACLALLTAFVFTTTTEAASTGGAADQPVVHQLLNAMAQNDYQAFIGQGTTEFGAITQQQFSEVANSISPRLKQGYTVQHLGNLRQQGLDISVWKISFSDQGDELLATLNVRNGKVGGFFLR